MVISTGNKGRSLSEVRSSKHRTSMLSYPIDDNMGHNQRNGASVIFDVHKIENGNAFPEGKAASLYLPQGFQVADAVSYTNGDLGKLGMITKVGVEAGTSSLGVLRDVAAGILDDGSTIMKSIFDGNSNTRELSKAAAAFLETKQGQRGGVQAGARATRNPYTVALFDRVNTRVFTFSFIMIPTSSQEATRIKQIINMFRTELYPSLLSASGVETPGGYNFPNVFKIHVVAKGQRFANQFKLCQLSGVNTTYNSNSMAFHEDGNPVQTEMTISFTEIETLNRSDVEEGY